uniref:GG12421 n=1 Tax=Drosophila erecta TaxID=7220 RepID=B3P8H1_DROER
MVTVVIILLLYGLLATCALQPADTNVRKTYEYMSQLRPLGLAFAEYFKNATLESLGVSDSRLASAEDMSCSAELAELGNGLSSRQTWALRMIDSWGSLPNGLLTGNSIELGNFDECLSINQVTGGQRIAGKYCFLLANSVRIATCFPASCSSTQMEPFVEQLMALINLNSSSVDMRISEASCQTSEVQPWDGLTIFTIVILSLMAVFVASATIFDYFLCAEPTTVPALVKAFSARANSRALFRIAPNKSNPHVIGCLHGIRCMTLFWVIYSHEFIFSLTSPNLNTIDLYYWAAKPLSSVVLHGYFAVDSFFVLGGLLVSMIALRSMEKTGGRLNPVLMYLHRILRILPVVAIAILIYTKMMTVVSGGPMFKHGYHGMEYCENGWLWTLLFIQNYAVFQCLDHTWYLAVDMQLFIISPILLIALYKWGKKAAAGIAVLVVLLSGCLFATQMVNHYSMLIKNNDGDDEVANKKLYLATHTHAAPWLIGFLFGYFLYTNREKKFQLSRPTVWIGWLLSLALLFTSIFALYPASMWNAPPLSTLEESLYYTLTRLAWPLAICWIIFACMQGYGGLANSFLSTPLWQPLSRLSYSVYIWHMFVQEVNSRNVRTNTYFSNYFVMQRFFYDLGFTVLMSYISYLIIEAPLCGFDGLLRRQKIPSATLQANIMSNDNNLENRERDDLNAPERNPINISEVHK